MNCATIQYRTVTGPFEKQAPGQVYKKLKTTNRNTHTSKDCFYNTTRVAVSGIFHAASLRSLRSHYTFQLFPQVPAPK